MFVYWLIALWSTTLILNKDDIEFPCLLGHPAQHFTYTYEELNLSSRLVSVKISALDIFCIESRHDTVVPKIIKNREFFLKSSKNKYDIILDVCTQHSSI